MEQRKIKVIVKAIITGIILIMTVSACSNKIKKNKLLRNNINALNNGDTTTIDITGTTPSPESQHEHIYKTLYDDTKHWEECTVCGIERNETIHSLITKYATSSLPQCNKDNYYTSTCECGYSKTGHKPCVWNGSKYAQQYPDHIHPKVCSICNGFILHQYYIGSYGNGNLYEEDWKGQNKCHLSDGTILDCEHSGKCVVCGYSYIKNSHNITVEPETNKLYCDICNYVFGTCFTTLSKTNNAPTTYTFITKITFTGEKIFNISSPEVRNINSPFSSITSKVTEKSSDGKNVTITSTATFKSTWKGSYDTWIYVMDIPLDGAKSRYSTEKLTVYADGVKPIISNIQLIGNEWRKTKTITIKGTENWTNMVNVKIENDRGRVVYQGGVNVTNNNWSISCTPEIEAGEESRTFTVTVTDACENSTTMDFDISKVDGRPPTVTSSDKVTDSEWAREKTFTFTAEDLGIGGVEIGFNDVNDYSPAIKNGNNYSKEYKFVGDAYSPVQASVYYKDELGNITTQLVTLEKIDNTAPTITNAVLNNNVVNITSHDRHSSLGEGSGVVKYRYITSTEKLENPEITVDNSQEIGKDEMFTISNINEVKYIYIVAEDLVGNVSGSYEIEVPKLVLRSEVNEEGTVTLDWTGYDITNKYFVVYCKQEGDEEWKTVVGLDEKLNSNTYTLGNDIAKPNIPEMNIEKDIETGQIKINQTATDNGTTYIYYIEAYDKNTSTLIAKSNIN